MHAGSGWNAGASGAGPSAEGRLLPAVTGGAYAGAGRNGSGPPWVSEAPPSGGGMAAGASASEPPSWLLTLLLSSNDSISPSANQRLVSDCGRDMPGRFDIGLAPSRWPSSVSQRVSWLCPGEPNSWRMTASRSSIISSALLVAIGRIHLHRPLAITRATAGDSPGRA